VPHHLTWIGGQLQLHGNNLDESFLKDRAYNKTAGHRLQGQRERSAARCNAIRMQKQNLQSQEDLNGKEE
jgi:hypothetical protein